MGREGRATANSAIGVPLAELPGIRAAWAAVPLALLAIGAVLRLVNLGGRELFRDEAASWLLSSYPLGSLLDHARFEAYPPLYAVALQLWTGFLGDGEAAMRTLSVIAGVATLAMVWAWARQALGRAPASMALALAALSAILIDDSRDARMYAIETAFTTASWWLAWRLAVLPPGKARWQSLIPTAAALAVTSAGELWALALGLPTAALQVAFAGSVAVASVVQSRRSGPMSDPARVGDETTAAATEAVARAARWWARFPRGPVLAVAAIAVGASTFLAWLPALLAVATNGHPFWTGRPNLDALPQTFGRVVGAPSSVPGSAELVALLLVACGVAGIMRIGRNRATTPQAGVEDPDPHRGRRQRWLAVALVMAISLCPIVWLYSQVRPIYDARYFGSIAPPLCLLIASGWGNLVGLLRNRLVPAILMVALLALMSAGALSDLQAHNGSTDLDPAEETVARLVIAAKPGDVILTNDARTYFPIDYYLHRAGGEQSFGLRVYDWYAPNQPFFYGTYLIASDRVVTPDLVDRLGWARALPDLRSGRSIWLITVTAGNRTDIGFAPVSTGQLIEQSRQVVSRPGQLPGKAGQIRKLVIP